MHNKLPLRHFYYFYYFCQIKLKFIILIAYMQAGSDALPFRSAFKNVIFGKCLSLNTEVTPGIIQNKLDGKGKSLLFKAIYSLLM